MKPKNKKKDYAAPRQAHRGAGTTAAPEDGTEKGANPVRLRHTERPEPGAAEKVYTGFGLILEGLAKMGYPVDDENFRETGPRAAKALMELVRPLPEIEQAVTDLVEHSFPATYDEMVISKHNISFGVCPHHLLPVIYRISVAYLPLEKVLGISKLSRLVSLMARRPALQEQLTQDLAEVLYRRLGSRGSAVYAEGLHLCMAARGIQAHEARVVTSAVRGMFRDQSETRQEFLKLVTASPLSLL
ncbi:MAG TPA: GTP cyclohydrolase I [Polyangia bacterium]|jgi:GTP cyclohydrolase I|nr:GTP cyclohydrolase I [Polyangia bacterium]